MATDSKSQNSDSRLSKRTKTLTIIGIFLTIVTFVIAGWWWTEKYAPELAINELGDFIGGFAAAIAVIWLVLGYYIQSAALSIQSQELKENTTAQKDQTTALNEQAEATRLTAQAITEYSRPYVTAGLELEGRHIVVRVANAGHRPALNVRVTFGPSLKGLVDSPHDPSNILTPDYLPPGSQLREELVFAPSLYFGKRKHVKISSTVQVSYSDEMGKQYQHLYSSSIEQRSSNAMKEQTIRTSLNQIAQGIGSDSSGDQTSIKRVLSSIDKKLDSTTISELPD